MTKVNIEDNYYHGWFNGKDESDDSAYMWLTDKETFNTYIEPMTKDEAIDLNSKFDQIMDVPPVGYVKAEDTEELKKEFYNPLAMTAIGMVATYAVYCGHIVMSETGGYKKVGNWIKQKSEKVKSKFKKKAE